MADAVRERPALMDVAGSSRPAPAVLALRAEPRATGWGIADALLGVVLLLGVLVAGNVDQMPRGIEEFFAVRLTLKNILLVTGFALLWPGVLWTLGLYEPERLRYGWGEWPRLLVASGIACLMAMVFPLTSESGASRPIHALLFATLVAPAAAAVRTGARVARRANEWGRIRQVLLVGSGPLAKWVYRGLGADRVVRHEVLGFVDSDPQPALVAAQVQHLGNVHELERILMHRVVDEVFIALPVKSRYEEIQQAIRACERVGVPVTYPTPLFKATAAPDDIRLLFKRLLDLGGAAVGLVVVSPLLVMIALAVKLTSHGPVLFSQERYGFMKRRFRMLKFRTMVADAEDRQAALEIHNEASGPVFKIRNDPRVTRLGRILRKTSLDELPQLWHVLTGEMSLVGPRPLPVRDVGRFAEPWVMRRFSVRPGLTCLWQISGRSTLSFDDWIELDLQYIDRWSMWLDFEILARTVPAVLRGRGAT